MDNIKATSRSGYYGHVVDVHAKTQREVILDCLAREDSALTRLQISKITGIRLTSVCGRVKALLENKQLFIDHEDIDPATGRVAEYLRVELRQSILF